jgi:hypothetical protein
MDDDDADVFKRTVSWQSSRNHHATFTYSNAGPGTGLFARILQQGGWSLGIGTATTRDTSSISHCD